MSKSNNIERVDIRFVLYDTLHIQIETDEYAYLKGVEKELTEYVKGYQFTPLFRAGHWNGRVSLFKKAYRSFPYGILLKVIKYTKSEWSDLTYEVTDPIKNLFKGISFDGFHECLKYKPRDYQKLAIETAITRSKGICQLPTASGKSLIIAYIINHINENIENNTSIIIVPTLQLITQFKGDLLEYGISEEMIGCVNADLKEFDKRIVISTWQSMKNITHELYRFNTVIIDEVHGAHCSKLLEILQACPEAQFRIGMTGTMPTHPLDNMNVLSLLGPVLIQYTGKDLANMGYISHCTVKMLNINYKDGLNQKNFDYTFVRDTVFPNPYRLGLICELIQKTKNSVLILIEKVEKEGEVLEELLKERFPKKNVIFLSGRDKSVIRDNARKEMDNVYNMVIIATYPIFQQGVNIPSLRTIILASSTKSFIRVIQSLGRSLRKHVSKEEGGAELYDICDQTKYLKDHAVMRERHYIKEGHEIETIELYEEKGVYNI